MWMNNVEVSTKVVNQPLHHIDFPHLSIKSNFSFHTKYYDYFINIDSSSSSRAKPRLLPSISAKRNTTATVIFREHLLYDAVEKAITDHIGSDKHLLTKRAWENVVNAIGVNGTVLPKYVELNVDLSIETKYLYVHIIGINNELGLKICFEPETRCCVCTKKIGGDTVGLRMACEHALHGGCIVRWLKRNRKCSLCGYKDLTVEYCCILLGFLQPFVMLCAAIIFHVVR